MPFKIDRINSHRQNFSLFSSWYWYEDLIMDKQKLQELKEKLPSLSEVGSMASKLFKDIKKSVGEIADDYKLKHPEKPSEKKSESGNDSHDNTDEKK